MSIRPNGASAIMASRLEPPDSLEFFPTPPWATRALMTQVLGKVYSPLSYLGWSALEPACGEGHMVEPLREYFGFVCGSDIHDYGAGYALADFLDPAYRIPNVEWVITNPPFSVAAQFAARCLDTVAVSHGVALLLRLAWLEGQDRYKTLFSRRPPHIIAPFVERVPMAKGRWDPKGDTATAYAWFVWVRGRAYGQTELRWIPPCREALHRQSDVERWCPPAPLPLFDQHQEIAR